MNSRELARLRLVAQHVAGPGLASAAEAVAWMTATQAQEFPSSLAAIALRTEGGTRADVESALNAGSGGRAWREVRDKNRAVTRHVPTIVFARPKSTR